MSKVYSEDQIEKAVESAVDSMDLKTLMMYANETMTAHYTSNSIDDDAVYQLMVDHGDEEN